MSYAWDLAERAMKSSGLEEYDIVQEGDVKTLEFPLGKITVVFSVMQEDGEFLLGSDDPLFGEKLELRVLCAEKTGESGCMQAAKKLCMELIRLDYEKMITGISRQNSRFDENFCCYEAVVRLDIRGGDRNIQ